jgi:glutamate formiminotransferase / 5-formyltetrahydrofolate cyclo-ligase
MKLPQPLLIARIWQISGKANLKAWLRKCTEERWKPDFGPDQPHPTAGVVAVGARMPLIAFNIDLATT